MESPESWSLLTGTLAVCNLRDVDKTWAFLVLQGLVNASESGRQALERAIAVVEEEGEITGPSDALRVANQLHARGITTPLSTTPDPWGKTAKSRIEAVNSWSESDP